MLDAFILKKLTHTGKIAYWIIQLSLDALFIAYLFFVMDYDMDRLANDGYIVVLVGILVCLLISAGICLTFWRKPKEEPKDKDQ